MHKYTVVVDTPHLSTDQEVPVAFEGDGHVYCPVCAELLYGEPRSAFDNHGCPLVPVGHSDTGDQCGRCCSSI